MDVQTKKLVDSRVVRTITFIERKAEREIGS
jgi:hypothetical protein